VPVALRALCAEAAGRSGIDGIDASQLDRDGWLDFLLMSHLAAAAVSVATKRWIW
jgi:hypothetical protein